MAPVSIESLLFTPGRACAGPLAIVLHEYSSGIEALDGEMGRCPRRRPAQSPGCHTSFHYGIGGACQFHQYVPLADTAWGFGVQQPTCPTPPCPPSECEECTGDTVGQYNTDLAGNPPVLPPFVLGPDGTVNCGVIHVAVTGQSPNIGGLDCCNFFTDRQAYNCLVQSLCFILDTAGLVASQTTLLVHCGELYCLDIDQLVADVLACQNAPEPPVIPCQCTPTPEQFCASVDALEAGDPAVYGTTIVIGADCETHLLPAVIQGQALTDCAGALLANGTSVVTEAAIKAPGNTDTTLSPTVLTAGGAAGTCVASLLAPDLSATVPTEMDADGASINAGFLVLAQGPADAAPRWRVLGGGLLNGGDVGPGAIDVNSAAAAGVRFVSTTGNQTINVPTSIESRTEIFIKNVSASPITVTGVGATIDGVAAITLEGTTAGTYPFGNNGGEAVHLVWNAGRGEWQVF